MKSFIVVVFVMFFSINSYAGYFEFSVTNNFRSSRIDENNFTKTNSLTGSVSYYFMEMSALELSYTEGTTEQTVKQLNQDPEKYIFQFRHYGLDFVFSLASRQSSFQPYVKAGAAYVERSLFSKKENFPRVLEAETEPEWLPSVGIGFKFKLTKNLAFKAGIDAWGDEDQNIKDWDNAARIGVSLFL